MKSLVWRAMADGAVGFSTGLQYVPGTYAQTREIIELARVAGNEGGVYASHMRNEGTALEAAIAETIRVGEMTGCRVQISHLKVDSPSRWGASAKALALIDAARARGVDRRGRSVRLHGGQLDARHPVSVVGARGRAAADHRAAERPGHVGEDQERDARRCSPSAASPICRFAVVASYRADPSLNGLSMKQVAAKLKGSGLRRRAVRGGARHDARRRRVDGLSLHVRRRHRADHAAPARRLRVGRSVLTIGRGRAASARLRQQRARARRVRARAQSHHARGSGPQDDVAPGGALPVRRIGDGSRKGTPPTSWSSTARRSAMRRRSRSRTPTRAASRTCW